jgi:hypothetical protein
VREKMKSHVIYFASTEEIRWWRKFWGWRNRKSIGIPNMSGWMRSDRKKKKKETRKERTHLDGHSTQSAIHLLNEKGRKKPEWLLKS